MLWWSSFLAKFCVGSLSLLTSWNLQWQRQWTSFGRNNSKKEIKTHFLNFFKSWINGRVSWEKMLVIVADFCCRNIEPHARTLLFLQLFYCSCKLKRTVWFPLQPLSFLWSTYFTFADQQVWSFDISVCNKNKTIGTNSPPSVFDLIWFSFKVPFFSIFSLTWAEFCGEGLKFLLLYRNFLSVIQESKNCFMSMICWYCWFQKWCWHRSLQWLSSRVFKHVADEQLLIIFVEVKRPNQNIWSI